MTEKSTEKVWGLVLHLSHDTKSELLGSKAEQQYFVFYG